MSHRVDRHLTKPDVDGGDVHTAAVFLLSFLLMGIVSTIMLAGQGVSIPDLSQNRIVTNILGGSRTPPKLADIPAEAQAPVVPVSATQETQKEAEIPEPAKPGPTRSNLAKVANTGNEGVYIRRTPNMEDRLVAWPDNTIMEVVGEDRSVAGTRWRQVKDPAGNVGWVPSQYLSE